MNPKLILITGLFFCFVVAIAVLATPIHAQSPTPTTPIPLSITPTPDLENRLLQVEIEQVRTIELLKSSNDYNQFLIQVTGGIIALLVAIQGFTTAVQLRREGRRDEHQRRREEKQDLVEVTGVEQVSKIMAVVQQTLESRLATEQLARTVAKDAQEQLEKVQKEVKIFERFYENFQTNIQKTRKVLDETASQWASKVMRHDFRKMADELNDFARRFDQFKEDSESLEDEKRAFSPRVPYIRGIAALISNQPEIAKQLLTEVAAFQQNESNETEIAYNHRIANANYYLGVIESNFGNDQDAIAYFENANKRDLQDTDILTKVVTAEAYVMKAEYSKAKQFLTEVENRLRETELRESRLGNHHLRLRSRAALIRANMAILGRESNWVEDAKQLLEPLHIADSQYYYATYTLAQLYAIQNETDYARNLFREAYETIISSNDLHIVREARSKIILLMVAGICAKHGFPTDKLSEDYLDQANNLRSSLPKIGDRICTVFSPLSKRNENGETIHYHIELIRTGKVLLEQH